MGVYIGDSIYNFCNGADFIPEMTLRFMFSDTSYNPQAAGVGTSGTWKKKLDTSYNVWDWTRNGTWGSAFLNAFTDQNNLVEIIDAGDTRNLTSLYKTFDGCTSLKSICFFNTENCTTLYRTFSNCEKLEFVPNYNTSKVTESGACFLGCKALINAPEFDLSLVSSGIRTQQMFDGCTSLEYVPNYNMNACSMASYMFRNCTSLKNVPMLICPNLVNALSMFANCRKVEGGALDFYNYLSTKTTSVTIYSGCFSNCGVDTVTGAAELAQIPSSWGGTGA